MIWPPLPKVVHGSGGPITVRQIKAPRDDEGVVTDGIWDPRTRTIDLTVSRTAHYKWQIFFHEMMHATLDDSGLGNLLPSESQEALCDAVATARLAEMVGSLSARL